MVDNGAGRAIYNTRLHWGNFLTFRDPDLEANYWGAQVEGLLKQIDRIVYVVGAVFTLLGFCRVREVSLVYSASIMCSVMIGWFSMIWWTFRRDNSYARWRTCCVACVRIAIVPLSSYRRTLLPPPNKTVAAVLSHMLFKSNVIVLFSLPIGLQIKFSTQVWIHAFCTVICMSFAPMYCNVWIDGTRGVLVSRIKSKIEEGLQMLMTLKFKPLSSETQQVDNNESDCIVVFTFCMWVLGFLMPCLCVYGMELHSRILYLMSGKVPDAPVGRQLWKAWREGMLLPCWTFLVASVIFYAILQTLFNLACGGPLINC